MPNDEVPSDSAKRNADNQRLALIHNEVDLLLDDSFRRQESISNKASFLAVASGVILSGLTAQTWKAPTEFIVFSMALTILALGLAAAALMPAKRAVLDARRMVDKYLDSNAKRITLEKEVLETKTSAWQTRNVVIERHAIIVTLGFWALVCAALVFGVGFTIHYIH